MLLNLSSFFQKMKNKFLNIFSILIALSFPSCRLEEHTEKSTNQIKLETSAGDFSLTESRLLNKAIKKANKLYSIDLGFIAIEKKLGQDDAGEAHFNFQEGKNIIFVQDFSFYKFEEDSLWGSIYMRNPSNEQLYERAVLHEIGHLLCDEINSRGLSKKLFEIDIQNEVAKKGPASEHPAHPSFYTFFYAGFKEAENSKELEKKNAEETFADIFALRVLGYLENVKDTLLLQKIKLVEKEIASYK